MIHFILSYLYDSLLGWVGIGGVIAVGCFAWAWFMPIFRMEALYAGICVVCVIFTYAKGYHDEYRHLTAQWKAAEERALKAGEDARADALRDAARGVRDANDSDQN